MVFVPSGFCNKNIVNCVANKQQMFISHSDGGWEVKIAVLADLVSCENPLPKGHIFLVT